MHRARLEEDAPPSASPSAVVVSVPDPAEQLAIGSNIGDVYFVMLDGVIPYVHTKFEVLWRVKDINPMGVDTPECTIGCRDISTFLQRVLSRSCLPRRRGVNLKVVINVRACFPLRTGRGERLLRCTLSEILQLVFKTLQGVFIRVGKGSRE